MPFTSQPPDTSDPSQNPNHQRTIDERRVELQVEQLFRRFVCKRQSVDAPAVHAEEDCPARPPDTNVLPAGQLLCADLPAVLREYDAMRAGRREQGGDADVDLKPLIDPHLLPQIEGFAAENPQVGIESSMLVQMIIGLQSEQDPTESPSDSSSSSSASSVEGDSLGDDDRASSPGEDRSRSQEPDSEDDENDVNGLQHQRTLASSPPIANEDSDDDEIGMDYSASQSMMQSQRKSFSSSTPARRTSASGDASTHPRKSHPLESAAKERPGSPLTDDVLRAHGKAKMPPTAWARPKPGLRARSSDTMPPSPDPSDSHIVRPHFRRISHRGSSDRGDISASSEEEEGIGRALPVSGYAETSFAANTSSTAALVQENERLHRARNTLERTLETKEDEHEAQVAALHAELEAINMNLLTRKREEREAALKAAHAADQVASLEAELAALTRRNADLEGIQAKGREQLEYLMAETEQLRHQREQLREQVVTLKESEEYEREQAEITLDESARLKRALEEKEQRVEQLLGLQSENEKLVQDMLTLRTTVSKLKDELEERARAAAPTGSVGRSKGSGSKSSLDGTPSRRLGAELARELSRAQEEAEMEAEEDADADGTFDSGSASDLPDSGEGEDSSFVETVTRRYKNRTKKRAAAEFAEQETQTDAGLEQDLSSDRYERVPPPPSYDEAALEKAIVERLHPPLPSKDTNTDLSTWPEYCELSHQVGVRCTLLEARMRAQSLLPSSGHTTRLSSSYKFKVGAVQLLHALTDLAQGRFPRDPRKLGGARVHVAWAVLASVFLLGMLVAHIVFPATTVQIGPYSSSLNEFSAAHSLYAPVGTAHVSIHELPSHRWLGSIRSLREYRGTSVPF